MPTEISRPRGRPRKFDAEDGVRKALGLFHARGYEGVSVEDITDLLGINTPSFYAAYGSKRGLFERAFTLYANELAVRPAGILKSDLPTARALGHLLQEAAILYSGDDEARGCLAFEAARCSDPEVRRLADANGSATAAIIRSYVEQQDPVQAGPMTDYIVMTMAGLSRLARSGVTRERLLQVASIASAGIAAALGEVPRRDQDAAKHV